MRPLKLTMQAFGPYASKEEIDFTRLGSRTMFVISGKTGAGKTTIFDGISYAIYGKASGEDRNGPDLRSQFAEEGLPTEIALEFSLRNKRYYIKRSPQQEKKKDRGEGFTTVGAKAELYLYDEEGNWQLLAANVRDTDIKIKEIMLIDSNQFRQILMIPQGEFRKLLTSDSKDKEVILQRLFHTEIYKRVEEKLKKEATDLKNLVEMQMNDRDQAIRHIQAFFHDELKDLLDEGSTNDTIILPLLKEEIDQSAAELLKLKKEMDEKEREKDKLQQQLFEAETILKQIRSKEELQLQKAVLEEQKPIIDEKEQSIIQAQKAALLMNQEEQCDRLKRELEGAKGNVEAILKEIKSLMETYSECEHVLNREKEREAERNEALEQINVLKNMEEAVRSISRSRLEVDELDKQLHEKSADKKRMEERIKAADQEIQKRNEERKQIEKEQLVFYENERKMDKLEREYEQLVQYKKQQNSYKQTVLDTQRKLDYFQHSLTRYEDAKALVAELEQRWLHGQAAILANKLQNGESCPVCGSTHHPSRAVSTREDIPNEEDLKAAKHEATRLETEKSSAESAFFKAQSTEKTLEENLMELLNRIVEHKPHFVADELEMVKSAVWEEKQMLQTEQRYLQKKKEKLLTIIDDLEKYEKENRVQSDQLLHMTEVVNGLTIQFTQKNTLLLQMLEKVPKRLQTITAYETELQTAVRHHETLVKNLEYAEKRYQQTNESLRRNKYVVRKRKSK